MNSPQALTPQEGLKVLLQAAPKPAHAFIQTCFQALQQQGVNILVDEGAQVQYNGIKSSGFFEDKPLTFAVATGKPFDKWFSIFVHEYCHFEQWMEDPVKFAKTNKEGNQLFAWVDGSEELSPQQIQEFAKGSRELEFDCESRTIQKMEQMGLGKFVDLKQYARGANAYFNFYHYVAKHRQWYEGGQEPYTLPEVYTLFPEKLQLLSSMSAELEGAYSKCVKAPEVRKGLRP